MIKYSLQNECLENIEAFSDEQMNREMAVIESVLEIYDKTILMMELSNSDVDIPDCSMFMESTFFQEQDQPPTENSQTTNNGGEGGEGGQSAPATQDGQQQNNGQSGNDTQKTPPTEAERKKYNSEHQFRQMNKKGNIENMFISIIAFIPRLFGFLIQCIVKLFKKIGNKKADDAVNNTDKNLGNLNDEQKKQLAAEIDKQPSDNTQEQSDASIVGKLDVVSGTYTWWDQNSVLEYLENCKKALEGINFSDSNNFINNSTGAIHQLTELIKSYKENPGNNVNSKQYQNVPGSLLIKSRDLITQKLNDVQTLAQSKSDESKNMKLPFIGKGNEKAALKLAKDLVNQLKIVIKELAGFTTELWKGVETAANNALAVENFTNGQQQLQNQNNTSQPQQNQQQQPQQQPVNNEGGEK